MSSRVTASALLMQARHPRPGREARRPVRAAYAALAWVVVFFAFHVYWYLGGSFGLNGELPKSGPGFGGWLDL